jgi:hypothetical protein
MAKSKQLNKKLDKAAAYDDLMAAIYEDSPKNGKPADPITLVRDWRKAASENVILRRMLGTTRQALLELHAKYSGS